MPSAMRDRVAADIEGWDAIDDHRTGTPGDRRTSDWLARLVADAGGSLHRDDFPLSRWVLGHCAVEAHGRTVVGVPLFDAGTTGPEGIVGDLVPLAEDAGDEADGSTCIGLGALGNQAGTGANRSFAAARAAGRHAALVAVAKMDAGVPGLALQNAERFRSPVGPPTLQVATGEETWLRGLAAGGGPVRVTAHVTFETALGSNVSCTIAGRDPTLAPLIVMTPKSAWWVCTAERGGGIAVWLALLRHFAVQQPQRDIVFVATSGHELGHLGLDHFLAANPIRSAQAWIHLGANFAAAGSSVRLQASDAELLDLARSTMVAADAPPTAETPLGERPFGEARDVYDLGERFVSLLGSNAWFHHPDDRWPTTIDLDHTCRIAEAVIAIADRLC